MQAIAMFGDQPPWTQLDGLETIERYPWFPRFLATTRILPGRRGVAERLVSTSIPSLSQIDQAATAGSPTRGSSLTGEMLSSVMTRER